MAKIDFSTGVTKNVLTLRRVRAIALDSMTRGNLTLKAYQFLLSKIAERLAMSPTEVVTVLTENAQSEGD